MHPLGKYLRNQLERTVKQARDIAETAARAVLEQLGVGEPNAFDYLDEEQRHLRRRLRAHGRQLGDLRNAKSEQAIDCLVEEVAYEHWHRMLFARFLAENNLLMYPDPTDPVAVSLDECEELAPNEGAANGWELAARYASQMLPQIFRLDSPVFELHLPPEHQQKLEGLLVELQPSVFSASDSLGWVYQFWQSNNKDRINKSEVKIGARELPAVTQLFTEPYMVSFLLDNALGAWWAARRLTKEDLRTAASEDELRQKASIPGVSLEYLRFVKQENDTWIPAAGTFDSWPQALSELKTLDPCCGSGHFLVAVFLMLVPMRMELEGLSARESVDAVLRENIHGLELDQRCVELAAFALALTAWVYPNAGGYRALPDLHVACSGLSVGVAKEEWKKLALDKHNLNIALDWLYESFKDAPVLGSLLDPAKSDAAKLVQWPELQASLQKALTSESDDSRQEAGVVAKGIANTAQLLSRQYNWVITNVPYLARSKQDLRLQNFCEEHYSAAKNDLATVFLERCLRLCVQGGTSSVVLPQNWLFLTSYRKFREKLLKQDIWHLIARLGPQAFQTPMWDFNVQLISISRGGLAPNASGLFGEAKQKNQIRGIDASQPRTALEKAQLVSRAEVKSVSQEQQLTNPDFVVVLEEQNNDAPLSQHTDSFQGLKSGDDGRMRRQFWEFDKAIDRWKKLQSTVSSTTHYGGMSSLIDWENQGYGLARRQGLGAWTRKGITISQMNSLPCSLYAGDAFDSNVCPVLPANETLRAAIWMFAESGEYRTEIRKIDQKVAVANATTIKVPFDPDRWKPIAESKYPNGLPKPYSDDLTQWIFHGHPCGSVVWDEEDKRTAHGLLRTDDSVLQVAVTRLLGYRWPSELDPEIELADEQREWVNRCEALLPFADDDGIVCIPPVRGEASAADRLESLLAAAYGSEWNSNVMSRLITESGHKGKSLESWLREKFFTQHCKLFQHRPFIWHIWDGLHDGFSVLVNYHKLDYKTLETLIYTYLGDWISRQKRDRGESVDGAEEKIIAAEQLKKRLELILHGEAPYDIFVRWKPLAEQPIGWNPDLNDGVRLNIRPFLTVTDVGKKGAGVLRDKPNIKWTKDRGQDVESAPWYSTFGGDRINDYHLTLNDKNQVL